MRNNAEKKVIAYQTALILMALYFSLLETLIPKPIPWMRIGLSNIATIIAIDYLGFRRGAEVLFLRIAISSVILGTVFTPGFFISLGSGTVSIVVMGFLFLMKKHLSLISISSISGMIHNASQLAIAYFLFFRKVNLYTREIIIFIGTFLLIGAIAGAVTGFFAEKYKLKKNIQ